MRLFGQRQRFFCPSYNRLKRLAKSTFSPCCPSRFFFILAITIPFDIRDLEADGQQELKTIPMLLGEKNSLKLSYFFLFIFLLGSAFHYAPEKEWMILSAMCLSGITTYFFLKMDYFKKMSFYHYGILDGTLLLQGMLVIIFGCFACI